MPISNGERPGGVFRGMPSWRREPTRCRHSPVTAGRSGSDRSRRPSIMKLPAVAPMLALPQIATAS